MFWEILKIKIEKKIKNINDKYKYFVAVLKLLFFTSEFIEPKTFFPFTLRIFYVWLFVQFQNSFVIFLALIQFISLSFYALQT